MTKNEARAALAGTWRFEYVKDLIALREANLIDAVYAHETANPPNPSGSLNHADMKVQHLP